MVLLIINCDPAAAITGKQNNHGVENMAMKRLIIEFGQGVDMHGGDQNNAVLKATKDAIHHCCMAGISEIFDITDRKTQAYIKADIYAPHPEEVDPSVVTDYLSWWNVDAEVHQVQP